jgi:putative phosphoesterase
MLVAVVSDTHGNREGVRCLAERLKGLGVAQVLHLGDDYRDAAEFSAAGFEVLAVPGSYCPEYSDPQIPNRRLLELAGVQMLLTHTRERHRHDLPGDPDPQAPGPGVRLVLYGHTHIPAIEERQGVLWVNPGHLRDRMEKGFPPTFALLRFAPEQATIEIRRLEDGELMMQGEI